MIRCLQKNPKKVFLFRERFPALFAYPRFNRLRRGAKKDASGSFAAVALAGAVKVVGTVVGAMVTDCDTADVTDGVAVTVVFPAADARV